MCLYLFAGRKLLLSVLSMLPRHPNVVRVYLHVQTSNADALAFYPKFGFTATGTIAGYYKRIEPADAVLLEYFPADSSTAVVPSSA